MTHWLTDKFRTNRLRIKWNDSLEEKGNCKKQAPLMETQETSRCYFEKPLASMISSIE